MRALLVIACLLFFISGCSEKKTFRYNSKNFKLVELADGVYACIHKFGGKAICNVGIIDNGDETIIFDTFITPSVANELFDVVEGLGLSPIKYVINSHSHNDHIRGNQVFAEDVKIISTRINADLIEENEPLDIEYEREQAPSRFQHYDTLYNNFNSDTNSREFKQLLMWRPYYEVLVSSHKEIQTRLPDTFFENEMSLDGPDRSVKLITKGKGHTESDIILYLQDNKIVFAGDLVFNDCHPYIPHGDPDAWKDWLTFIQTLDVSTVVPGHGETGPASELEEMKQYIVDVEKEATKMFASNKTTEQVSEMPIPDQYKDWWFDRFYYYNLNFMYEKMNK